MKNLIFYLQFLLVLVFLTACQPANSKKGDTDQVSSFDEAAESDAIMKVIEHETDCFFKGDYACWASNWSQKPYAMQAWNNSDGSADVAVGWDTINAQGKGWIEKYYKNGEIIIHPVVKRDKPFVKFFNEKTAYLSWKQYNADTEKTYFRTSQEVRLMEKEADGWKIVNVSAFWDTQPKIPFDSLRIN